MSFSQNQNKYDTGSVEVMVEGIKLILLHILSKWKLNSFVQYVFAIVYFSAYEAKTSVFLKN